MNLPLAVWGTLLCGVALIALPPGRRARWWGLLSGAAVWASLLLLIDGTLAGAVDDWAKTGIALSVLWSVGFGACLTVLAQQPLARWGWMWLAVAGLAGAGCGRDWLTIGLSWELVRRATAALTETSEVSEDFGSLNLPSVGFWIAVIGWLFVAGSLDLAEIATVLQRGYAAHDPEVSIGRPALVVHAVACLTIVATLAPCYAFAARLPCRDSGAAVAAFCAQQVAALLVLGRCCGEVFSGLEASASWVLLVFAGAAFIAAVRCVWNLSRWDGLWIGFGCWQLSACLTWLLISLLKWTSLPDGLTTVQTTRLASFGLAAELAHTVLALAGAASAIRMMSREGAPPDFLDDLRGAARVRPLWSLLVFVPLASLIGLPALAGGWLRLLGGVAVWSLPQSGPNDTFQPHFGLIALQLTGLAAWVWLASALLKVFRVLVWDQSWTTWTPRRDPWTVTIAVVAAAALIMGGIYPQSWIRQGMLLPAANEFPRDDVSND